MYYDCAKVIHYRERAMVTREEAVAFLDKYLAVKDCARYDNAWNGLQVEGASTIKKIMFTTDAGIESFEKAVAISADMIVVHHGIFWQANDPRMRGYMKRRVSILLEHGISLYAAHLPLDKHPIVGNNAQILNMLGFRPDESRPFGFYKGIYLSFVGTTDTPKSLTLIEDILVQETDAHCKVLAFGPKVVGTLAVCSGGGGYSILDEAAEAGVDAYITGDATEFYHQAHDVGLNVIFAGHHATEIVGVRALSRVVSQELAVEAVFVDVPTGL